MPDSIVTVLNAASSYDLVDLNTVKDELGITDTTNDAKLARWITATSKRFANVCNIVFPEENIAEVFRHRHGYAPMLWGRDGHTGSPLVLSRRPVTLISSVTEDTTTLTTDDYEANPKAALLYRLGGAGRSHWRGRAVTVVYSAGFYPIPEDVQDAVLAIMKHKWALNGRDPLLRTFSIEGVGAESYWVPLSNQASDLPPDLQPVADTIAYYRDLVVA